MNFNPNTRTATRAQAQMQNMSAAGVRTTNSAVATRQATGAVAEVTDMSGTKMSISFDEVREFLCPSISSAEFNILMNICRMMHLNPFAKDVYIIKYDKNSPAQYVISKDAFMKAAAADPAYDGMESGVVVKKSDGTIEYRSGALYDPEDEKLLGGWAQVYRKDRKIPDRAEVTFREYDKGKSTWKEIPGTMIEKVATAQALRRAFPNGMSGIYTEDEIDTGTPVAPAYAYQEASAIPHAAAKIPAETQHAEAVQVPDPVALNPQDLL